MSSDRSLVIREHSSILWFIAKSVDLFELYDWNFTTKKKFTTYRIKKERKDVRDLISSKGKTGMRYEKAHRILMKPLAALSLCLAKSLNHREKWFMFFQRRFSMAH